MEQVKKAIINNDINEEFTLSELLKEFNPTIETHIQSVNDQVSEILMGRCPSTGS